MKFCAMRKLAYHIVEEEELERVTDSNHHEGVCMLIRRLRPWTVRAWLEHRLPAGPCCVLGLAGVSNPHNVGNVLRSAAHFGAPAVCMENPGAAVSGAAVRVAEGGSEAVDTIKAGGWPAAFELFREAGFGIIATSSHGGDELFGAKLPERCLILLGAEGEGLAKGLVSLADKGVTIPGSGAVESLNAAASAAVLLAEYRRRHPTRALRSKHP
jgi:TrmH RNA methyltransferase